MLGFCLNNTFPFPQSILWTNQRSCHGVTSKSNCGPYIHEGLWTQSHQHSTKHLEEVCGWYFCSSTRITQGWVFQSYQHSGYSHPIHCKWSWTRWFHPISGHFNNTQSDGTTKVYRKPTHTGQYLQWDSNHNLASKHSVINTLRHRARTICSTPELLNNELQHLQKVLRQCKYPRLAINKVLQKQHQPDNVTRNRHIPSSTRKKIPHCRSIYTGHL